MTGKKEEGRVTVLTLIVTREPGVTEERLVKALALRAFAVLHENRVDDGKADRLGHIEQILHGTVDATK